MEVQDAALTSVLFGSRGRLASQPQLPLAAFLQICLEKKAWGLVAQLLQHLGGAIEGKVMELHHGPCDVLVGAARYQPFKRPDGHLMEALSMLRPSKKPKLEERDRQASAAAHKAALPGTSQRQAVVKSLTAYRTSCRRFFEQVSSGDVAVAADASRVAGKDMLVAALCEPHSGLCCWAPPQALVKHLALP